MQRQIVGKTSENGMHAMHGCQGWFAKSTFQEKPAAKCILMTFFFFGALQARQALQALQAARSAKAPFQDKPAAKCVLMTFSFFFAHRQPDIEPDIELDIQDCKAAQSDCTGCMHRCNLIFSLSVLSTAEELRCYRRLLPQSTAEELRC